MQLTARLTSLLPEQSGAGKNGPWKKQDIIVETEGQYPKKLCISLWGDKFDRNLLKAGSKLDISFDLESREFNGKWYTDVKAWKIAPVSDAGSPYPDSIPSYHPTVQDNESSPFTDDDRPF